MNGWWDGMEWIVSLCVSESVSLLFRNRNRSPHLISRERERERERSQEEKREKGQRPCFPSREGGEGLLFRSGLVIEISKLYNKELVEKGKLFLGLGRYTAAGPALGPGNPDIRSGEPKFWGGILTVSGRKILMC